VKGWRGPYLVRSNTRCCSQSPGPVTALHTTSSLAFLNVLSRMAYSLWTFFNMGLSTAEWVLSSVAVRQLMM